MINQSTKEKGRWAAARIFGTLYRLNPKHMDEWIRKQKLANVSKYPLSRQGGSSSSGSSSGSGGSRRVAPPIRQDMFLVPIHRWRGFIDYGKDLQTRLEDRKFGFLLRNKTISLNICIDVREVFNAKVIIVTI